MRAPIAFAFLAINLRRACPALWRAKDDHRPRRTPLKAARACLGQDLPDFSGNGVERRRHLLMNLAGFAALDEIWLVTIALEELPQLVVGNTRQETGIGNLVAVQMKDRQHHSVAGWIEELVPVPTGGQRAGLGFAVAHDARDDQVRVVERCPVSVGERVAQFATFMNRTGRLGRDMTGNATGEAELLEQSFHAFL